MSKTERAVFEVFIRGTLDQVWSELTRTDAPQRAMFNSYLHTDRLARGAQLGEDVLELVDAVSRLSPAAARRATKLMSGVVRTVAH